MRNWDVALLGRKGWSTGRRKSRKKGYFISGRAEEAAVRDRNDWIGVGILPEKTYPVSVLKASLFNWDFLP